VVTHQLQVERRTGNVRRSQTDVIPLCHADWNRFLLFAVPVRYTLTRTGSFVTISSTSWSPASFSVFHGRITASAGPGAVPNVGPLQTYNQVTTPTDCRTPKLQARGCCSTSSTL